MGKSQRKRKQPVLWKNHILEPGGHTETGTHAERQSTPEQAARGEPVFQPEPAKKETFQDKVISPESPGEDRHIKDRDRIKSTSSFRSGRRQESRGSPGRHRDSRADDSAKRKAPELTEVYNYSHNSWKGEETKKRSKRNSPGRSDQAYS